MTPPVAEGRTLTAYHENARQRTEEENITPRTTHAKFHQARKVNLSVSLTAVSKKRFALEMPTAMYNRKGDRAAN